MNTKLLASLAAALTGLALASSANAAPFMFGTFTEPSASQGFHFTNNGTSGAITASTAVDFEFTSPTGLPTTDRPATLTISGITTTASTSAGSLVEQPLTGPITLSLTETGTGKNLLSVIFNGNITGILNSHNADLTADDTTANSVTYTSDYLTFGGPGNSFNLGLATLSPTLSVGAAGFLNSFIANIDGQFSADSNTTGTNPPSPEPASLSILALGAATLLTRRRKA